MEHTDFRNGENFDWERSKSKDNEYEVKALVDHQTHKFHEQNILCQEAAEKEAEKRKELF